MIWQVCGGALRRGVLRWVSSGGVRQDFPGGGSWTPEAGRAEGAAQERACSSAPQRRREKPNIYRAASAVWHSVSAALI